jgi:tripeptidyl-peptidase-2
MWCVLSALSALLASGFAPQHTRHARTARMQASTLPKDETGVSQLRDTNPEADGRGVLVAVLDTGCDLAAAGLQTTSTGQPKYVDFLDCTGGGDIDMSVSRKKSDDGTTLEGASGATLTLGAWADSVDEFRVGAAPLWTLLPGSTRERVLAERKELFEATHRAAANRMQRDLDAAENWTPSAEDEGVWGGRANATAAAKKARKTELEARLKELDALMKDDYDDAGPLIDVVAFRDEHGWRAVVDAEGTGDLTDSKPMAPFGVERQLGTFGFGSACTFCLQIGDLDDNGALSIVCDAGSHGTHVAGIVAANFEAEDDAADGVAPCVEVNQCVGCGRRVDGVNTP